MLSFSPAARHNRRMTSWWNRAIYSLLLFLLMSASRIPAWDEEGHRLIAGMAYPHLNPKARQSVNDLAHEMTGPVGQPYDPITLACWMDDIKKNPGMADHGRFLSWHYIDIPIDARDPMPSFELGADTEAHGNVVQALKRAVAVLQGGADPYIRSRAMACAMVLHLVGDTHQPLHCATKYFLTRGELHQDFGGNKEDVMNGPPGAMKFNLHAFWDSAYRASFDPDSGNILLEKEGADSFGKDMTSLNNGNLLSATELEPDFAAWARQSNVIARDFVYREITVADNRKYCRLSTAYVAKARKVARRQMEIAAWRLATVLNETLGATPNSTPPSSWPSVVSPAGQ